MLKFIAVVLAFCAFNAHSVLTYPYLIKNTRSDVNYVKPLDLRKTLSSKIGESLYGEQILGFELAALSTMTASATAAITGASLPAGAIIDDVWCMTVVSASNATNNTIKVDCASTLDSIALISASTFVAASGTVTDNFSTRKQVEGTTGCNLVWTTGGAASGAIQSMDNHCILRYFNK